MNSSRQAWPAIIKPAQNHPGNHSDHRELEERQRAIADQQRQIVRFQKYAVFGGLGWALLTLATDANGPVWVAVGMLMIVLMDSSTYIWQYIPRFR